MVTIKDIARKAGVSQGTVSNVLNNKGNVSSAKIQLVKDAAAALGYTVNNQAKTLREGSSYTLAVMIPTLYDRRYVDFLSSFQNYANSHDYLVELKTTGDEPNTELAQLDLLQAERVAGIAAFSCLPQENNAPGAYHSHGFSSEELVFVERRYQASACYLGFDYQAAGADMAAQAAARGYHNVILFSSSRAFSCEDDFCRGFTTVCGESSIIVHAYQIDLSHQANMFLQLIPSLPMADAVFCSNSQLAAEYRRMSQTFAPARDDKIYSVAPLTTIPGGKENQYELNYRLLGRSACKALLANIRRKSATKQPQQIILRNDGFHRWHFVPSATPCTLTVLTLDSPAAHIMRSLTPLYEKATGVKVRIAISYYDGIYDLLSDEKKLPLYDIIRLDHTWLSWFAESIYMPLEQLDPDIRKMFNGFIGGLEPNFTTVDSTLYALPWTPSAQLLFYRKDLFQDSTIQRLYKEKYRKELEVPSDFEEYNRIACFFTRKYNPYSPVRYGSTLTIGNSGAAATEYLTRYFSHAGNLFDESGRLLVDTPDGITAMQELVDSRQYVSAEYYSWWRETVQAFAKGDTAMTIVFSNYASEFLNYHSRIGGKIGAALVPGGNALIGGGSIGVCRESRHPQEALNFIKWVCSEEVTTMMTLLGSVSPCSQTYHNYEVLDTYPWLSLSRKAIAASSIQRYPKNIPHFNERQFLRIIGMAVNNVCSGVMDPESALQMAVNDYQRTFIE